MTSTIYHEFKKSELGYLSGLGKIRKPLDAYKDVLSENDIFTYLREESADIPYYRLFFDKLIVPLRPGEYNNNPYLTGIHPNDFAEMVIGGWVVPLIDYTKEYGGDGYNKFFARLKLQQNKLPDFKLSIPYFNRFEEIKVQELGYKTYNNLIETKNDDEIFLKNRVDEWNEIFKARGWDNNKYIGKSCITGGDKISPSYFAQRVGWHEILDASAEKPLASNIKDLAKSSNIKELYNFVYATNYRVVPYFYNKEYGVTTISSEDKGRISKANTNFVEIAKGSLKSKLACSVGKCLACAGPLYKGFGLTITKNETYESKLTLHLKGDNSNKVIENLYKLDTEDLQNCREEFKNYQKVLKSTKPDEFKERDTLIRNREDLKHALYNLDDKLKKKLNPKELKYSNYLMMSSRAMSSMEGAIDVAELLAIKMNISEPIIAFRDTISDIEEHVSKAAEQLIPEKIQDAKLAGSFFFLMASQLLEKTDKFKNCVKLDYGFWTKGYDYTQPSLPFFHFKIK